MAAECCSKNSQKYQRTVGYPSTSWASCFQNIAFTNLVTDKHRNCTDERWTGWEHYGSARQFGL